MKIVIAGGSGALGRRITDDLAGSGHELLVLTRRLTGQSCRQVLWDGRTPGSWAAELEGAALINLCGALVDRPPTPGNIELLARSRVEPTLALVQGAAALRTPPPVWVQMSTLAIYGDAGDRVLDETARPADGPAQMAGVARAWEQAAAGAQAGRVALLRTGIVLDPLSPALRRLRSLARGGLGGRIGTGRQWVSWLHVADYQAIIRAVLTDRALAGVIHATSPNPVTNADLMAALRQVLQRPAAPPTPPWLLRLGARALRSDPALALTGRRCVPSRLIDAGFSFGHPELRSALADLLGAGDA